MLKTLEITWLIMALIGVAGLILKTLQQEEMSEIGFFIIFSAIAVLMYFYRRRQRMSIERAQMDDTSDKYH